MTADDIETQLERLRAPRDAGPRKTLKGALEAPVAAPSDSAPAKRGLPVISVGLPGSSPREHEPSARDLEILDLLGEGGMGRVYLARQHSLEREVAIKSLKDNADERHRLALVEEGAITGYLEHPAIIPVHALGVDAGGRPVLVMKRVEGVAWLDLMNDSRHPLWKSRGSDAEHRLDDHIEILMQVCNAVHFAHSRRVIHRDIKPQNVLIGPYGDVYLADWGVARRMSDTRRPQMCGTPAYMAPEMVTGEDVDERTDVYLLGATLHEALTGTPRHEGENSQAVLSNAATSRPVEYDTSVPAALAAIANKATAASPNDRYQDAAEFRQALAGYLRHKSSLELAASALPRLERLREHTATEAGGAKEQREIEQCVAEARFALRQALEQWKDNDEAKARLEELEAWVLARSARTAELEKLARDLDPDVDAKARRVSQAVIAFIGVALAIGAFTKGTEFLPSREALVREAFFPLAAALVAVALMRKTLLRTAFNRRVIACLIATMMLIAVNRLLGAKLGASVSQLCVVDCLIVTATAFVTSTSTFRGMGVASIIMLGAATFGAFQPNHAFFAFSLGISMTLLGMLVMAPTRSTPMGPRSVR